MSNKFLTKEKIIDSLKTVVKDLGRIPTQKEYSNHRLSISSAKSVIVYFGSFDKGLAAAGIKPKNNEEEIIKSILLIKEDIGHFPSKKEYETNNKRLCSMRTIYKYFNSYKSAVNAAKENVQST